MKNYQKFIAIFMGVYFGLLTLCYFLKAHFVDIANVINLCGIIR